MATSLHLVHTNFIYQLELLTPTNTLTSKKFHSIDPLRLSEDLTTGLIRAFWVTWQGSDGNVVPTDLYDHYANHMFEVAVAYSVGPDGLKHEDAHQIILQDRFDISQALRDPDKFDGYNSSNPNTAIGLENRYRTQDELDRDDFAWILRQSWQCTVRETED